MCDKIGFFRMTLLILAGFIFVQARSGWGQQPQSKDSIQIIDRYIAVDNVCAWPNLLLLPDGTILAFIFNQPSHGLMTGDVECWASVDGGRLWTHRSTSTQHEPQTNRMNCAVGLDHDGNIILLASGWGYAPKGCTRTRKLSHLTQQPSDSKRLGSKTLCNRL